MIFTPLAIDGVWQVDLDRREDARGFFARTFCEDEFRAHGLHTAFPQCNISHNARRGTLRGLHFQRPPHGEVKLVRCTRGAILDVVVDLREGSSTCGRSIAVELTATNASALYIPAGFAHGFQTIEDQTEVFYHMGTVFEPAAAAGLRFDDPDLAIAWPVPDPILSDRDRDLPRLADIALLPA